MGSFEFAAPYVAPLGVPGSITLNGAKEAGYDGIEIHLLGLSKRQALERVGIARDLGLSATFHQAWSIVEGGMHLHNHVLHALGLLPRHGYRLADHIPAGLDIPAVVYADRLSEVVGHPHWWMQTATHSVNGHQAISFNVFMRAMRQHPRPVVFDTQHYLEFRNGQQGIGHLADIPWLDLAYQLQHGWKELHPCVREIHFCDCRPNCGNTRGRNVFPGEGDLPLWEFLEVVKASGWQGRVVPEVYSRHLGRGRRNYARLLAIIKDYFR